MFHSAAVVHDVLDPSRATSVIEDELGPLDSGIISCDRYSAYKCFARLNRGVVLAFCWAHQRRDFLALANAYPDMSPWAMGWVDDIAQLYHLNCLRLQAPADSAQRAVQQDRLQQAVQHLARQRDRGLADGRLAEPTSAVLRSMAYLLAALILLGPVLQAALGSGLASFIAHVTPLDLSLTAGLALAAVLPLSSGSSVALGIRLAVALLTLLRLVLAMQHLVTS